MVGTVLARRRSRGGFRRRRDWRRIGLIAGGVVGALALLFVVASWVGDGEDSRFEALEETPTPTPTPAPERWVGVYEWVEGEGDDALRHTLALFDADDSELLGGRLDQVGAGVERGVTVWAEPVGDGVRIVVGDVGATGPSPGYEPGTVLFALTDSPSAPTTELDALATLAGNLPVEGTYFRRRA